MTNDNVGGATELGYMSCGRITTPCSRREREAGPPLFVASCMACSCLVAYTNTMHYVSTHVSRRINSPLVPSEVYRNWIKTLWPWEIWDILSHVEGVRLIPWKMPTSVASEILSSSAKHTFFLLQNDMFALQFVGESTMVGLYYSENYWITTRGY